MSNKLDFVRDYTFNNRELLDETIEFLEDDSRLRGYFAPRRAGKSYLLSQDLSYNIANNVGTYIVIAPNCLSTRIIEEYVKSHFEQFDLIIQQRSTPEGSSLTFPNGSVVTFMSGLNDISHRLIGRRCDCLYIDELHYVKDYQEIIDTYSLISDITIFSSPTEGSTLEYLIKKGFSITSYDMI